MCNSRNSDIVNIFINGKLRDIKIDKCVSHLINYLNAYGVFTVASCCGHNKYPMTIIAKFDDVYKDMISNKLIPRKKRFYKKDKEGYYYIPEVLKNGNY